MYFANFRTTSAQESIREAKVHRWGLKFSAPKSKMEHGNELSDFMRNLERIEAKEVYFYDLDFAGSFIVQWLMKNDFTPIDSLIKDEDGKPIELEENQWRYVCNEKSGIYIITICWPNGVVTSLVDIWKILSNSPAELKEAAGIKEDFEGIDIFNDFTEEKKRRIELREMEEELDAIIYNAVKAFAKYKKRLTRSSMSYDDFIEHYNNEHKSGRAFAVKFGGKLWRPAHQKFEPYNVLSVEDWNFVHKSFNGGWNSWKEGIEGKLLKVKNGIVFDANAMHTSIAMSEKLPFGKLLYSKPLTGSYVKIIAVSIAEANKKDKRAPNIIRVKNNRYEMATYTDHIGYEERVYWEEEWEFIKKHYDVDYVTTKECYFRTEYSMKPWLESIVEQRHNYGDKIEKGLDKGRRNGVIGKMGQNIKLGSRVILRDGFEVSYIEKDREFTNLEGKVEFLKKGDRVLVDSMTGELFKKISFKYQRYGKKGEYTHQVRFEETIQRNHIGLASYVYMKARMRLLDVVFKNIDLWLYSDSDSGFFSDMPTGIKVDSIKFGFWKPQNKFDYFKVLRGKAYMFRSTAYWKNGRWVNKEETIAKVSGLNPEGKATLNFENFHEGHIVKNGKNAIMNVEGGKIKYKVDYKLGMKGWA